MKPEQGERGLWYAGTVGFATKEQAQDYIDRGCRHAYEAPVEVNTKTFFSVSPAQIAGAVALLLILGMLGWWAFGKASKPEDHHRKARLNGALACQKAIASLSMYGKREYPPSPSITTSSDRFVYSWKEGEFYFKNGFGVDVPQYARCEVGINTGTIDYLMVSGQTIIYR